MKKLNLLNHNWCTTKCVHFSFNIIILIALSMLLSGSAYSQANPNFHIYLCFGQSNMEGMGKIESQDRVTNARVKVLQDQTCSNLGRTFGQWYTAVPPLNRCWDGLGPADYFGKTMADGMPSNVTIGIVNTSVGGCDIAFFQKGAPLGKAATPGGGNADIPTQFTGGYAWMLDLAKKAQTVGVIKGIIFHQGETNTGNTNWKTKVQEIVNNLRTDLGVGNIPFLAGELLYSQYGSCCSSHNVEINKLPGIISNSHVISASGLPGADVAHFTSASYREFGKRYAQKMLTLVGSPSTCTPTPIVSYLQVNGGTWQQTSNVTVASGATVILGPQPMADGWTWTGCNTSGTARQQTIKPTQSCTAVATYKNECGATSTQTITITVSGTPSTTITSGTYKITAKHSNKSLNVENASTADGGNVIQRSYGGANNEKWFVTNLGAGAYSIKSVNSGKSLDVSGVSTADGADINQWTYNATNNQKWKIESVSTGYFRIVSLNSSKCIDIPAASTADGASINQWTCSGNDNQSFAFEMLSSATSRTGDEESKGLEQNAVVYPNPSSGLFTITEPGLFHYIIRNAAGSVMENGKGKDKTNVGGVLANGVYFLQVQTLKGKKHAKLIKN